jgi:hypothetical protein
MKKMMLAIAAMTAIASATASVAQATVAPNGKARGVTTVTLDQGTIGAVVGLGLEPAPVGPGVLGMDGAELKAAFPIVGNMKDGQIKHTGGLTLSGGGTVLALTNYTIDTNTGVLTAAAAVNGDGVGRIPLFDLGGAASRAGCAATASLSLDEAAAGALTAIFGAPDLTGAPFGIACVAPRA